MIRWIRRKWNWYRKVPNVEEIYDADGRLVAFQIDRMMPGQSVDLPIPDDKP